MRRTPRGPERAGQEECVDVSGTSHSPDSEATHEQGARSIVLLVAGAKGAQFLEGVVEKGIAVRKAVSYEQAGDLSSSYQAIRAVAAAHGIDFADERRPELTARDFVFVVGWQFLLPKGNAFVVVFHDSLLPRYRGFAPTVTALINGDERIGVSALRLAEQVDGGAILGQRSTAVTYPLKVRDALRMQTELMIDLAEDILHAEARGTLAETVQDEAQASLSLWRDDDDYWIDWHEPADRIARTVDALGWPYAGARTLCDGEMIHLVEVSTVELPPVAIRQPGKCWAIDRGCPIVICGHGAVRIEKAFAGGVAVKFQRTRLRFASPVHGGSFGPIPAVPA